jgi:hypothetical protein
MHWRRPEIRIGALVFAAVLGLLAVWLIATETLRANTSHFPMNSDEPAPSRTRRFAAAAAAQMGVVRGDLWADYAVTRLANLAKGPADPSVRQSAQAARNAARTAVKLTPADSRTWLLLALIDSQLDQPVADVLGLLKMSYYTALNDTAIMPFRLQIATRSAAIADPELQDFVEGDIRAMVVHRPELKSAVITAYGQASPEGQRFIEAKVNDLDRDLAATIRPAAH